MRFLMHVTFPHEPFSSYVRDGSLGQKVQAILGEMKPEATYFAEFNGMRTAMIVIRADDPSKIPSLAEPWFLVFEADVEFHVAMTPEDLAKSGLDQLGKKWGGA